MDQIESLQKYRSQVLEVFEKFECSKVRVFGSCARLEHNPESDIDFLVKRGTLDAIDMEKWMDSELEEILGFKIDVVYDDRINQAYLEKVLVEAKFLSEWP